MQRDLGGERTLLQTALFSLTSSRTSEVFMTRFANFRISFTASGACFLNCEESKTESVLGRARREEGGGLRWLVYVERGLSP